MKKSLLFVCLLFCSPTIYAQFSGSGSGTEVDPYQITDVWELYDVSEDLSAHYKLMADLDMTDWIKEENPTQGWTPIGRSTSNVFKGVFDGNGHTIKGLFISKSSVGYIGLFGYSTGATIQNLKIVDSDITGGSYVGAVLGYGKNVLLENIEVDGVKITASSYVGGVVGYAEGNINNCNVSHSDLSGSCAGGVCGSGACIIANSDVSSLSLGGSLIGGVAGNKASIENVRVTNVILNSTSSAGGIVASTEGYAKDCVLINPVIDGGDNVGGIVGLWEGASSASGNKIIGGKIKGKENVGGIVGCLKQNENTITNMCYPNVSNNYSSSNIEGKNYVGGICGTIYDAYYSNPYKPNQSYRCTAPTIISNRYDGRIISDGYGGGIVGHESMSGITIYYEGPYSGPVCPKDYRYIIRENISTGSILGNSVVTGVLGSGSRSMNMVWNLLTKNVCICDTIASTSNVPYKLFPYNVELKYNNYASSATVMFSKGEEIEVEDNEKNGTSFGKGSLKRKTTYTGIDYDFENTWTIVQGKTYPYNIKQCAPGEITSIEVGNTKVSGTAPADGKVYVFVGEKMYEGTITGGQWEVEIGKIKPGMEVRMSVETDNEKYPSVLVTAFAEKAHVNEETFTMASQYSTFCSTAAIDFSTLSDVKAYVAISMSDGKVKMKRVLDAPAGEGLLLKGTLGTYNLTKAQTSTKPTNLLVGVTTDTEVSPINGDYTNFILANGSSGIGFYTVSSTGVLTAGKAYLPILTTDIATSRGLIFEFDDSAISSIDDIPADRQVENVIYDLMGRKVSNESLGLSKGIYVIKGKKIIIK